MRCAPRWTPCSVGPSRTETRLRTLSVRYRRSALRDLADIEAYYRDISDDVHERVYQDIVSTLDAVRAFPEMYPSHAPGRRAVTPAFRFSILYQVLGDAVEVVGVYRHQDRP